MSYTLHIVHWVIRIPSVCSDPQCVTREDKYSLHLSEEDATTFIRQYYTEQKDSNLKFATEGPAKIIKHANGKTYARIHAYKLRGIFGDWATPADLTKIKLFVQKPLTYTDA